MIIPENEYELYYDKEIYNYYNKRKNMLWKYIIIILRKTGTPKNAQAQKL